MPLVLIAMTDMFAIELEGMGKEDIAEIARFKDIVLSTNGKLNQPGIPGASTHIFEIELINVM